MDPSMFVGFKESCQINKKRNSSTGEHFGAFLAEDARPYWSSVCDTDSSHICDVAEFDVDFSRNCVMLTALASSYEDGARFLFIFAKANGEMALVTSQCCVVPLTSFIS
jgi:hypothetical protein